MRAVERRLGRVFHLEFQEDDDFFGEINRFVREKNIRGGSVFLFGALKETDVITGFRELIGEDAARRHFEDWREFVALGNISWPERPPGPLGNVAWTEPQPYVHLHLALSGGPRNPGEVLVGHFSGGRVKGMFADLYELV